MLSRETLERYRRMTPSERMAMSFEVMRASTNALFSGTPETVDRRFELIRRQNDERNKNILAALAAERALP